MKMFRICSFVLAIVSLGAGQDSLSQSREKLAVGEHTADVAGIHFWYRVAGKGPLLVVQAPGWGAGSQYLQNGLARLESDFTVIYYDPRGSARTSRPSDPKLMATDDMIDDLIASGMLKQLKTLDLRHDLRLQSEMTAYPVRHPVWSLPLLCCALPPAKHQSRCVPRQTWFGRLPPQKGPLAASGSIASSARPGLLSLPHSRSWFQQPSPRARPH